MVLGDDGDGGGGLGGGGGVNMVVVCWVEKWGERAGTAK